MCQNCFTVLDAAAVNSVVVVAAASTGYGFVKEKLGLSPLARERRYLETAAMMRELGLDVATVLGPPPGPEGDPEILPVPQVAVTGSCEATAR